MDGQGLFTLNGVENLFLAIAIEVLRTQSREGQILLTGVRLPLFGNQCKAMLGQEMDERSCFSSIFDHSCRRGADFQFDPSELSQLYALGTGDVLDG